MVHLNPIYYAIVKDMFEISTLSVCCYYWLRWLAADKQKKLHVHFYFYCAIWATAFVCSLPAIMHLLELSLPWAFILFITAHQKTIQRNLIGLYKIKPAQQADTNWLEELIRFCLQADNELYFIIEHTDALNELLNIKLPLNAPITHQLMHYLIKCSDFDPTQQILLTTQGNVHGINVQWNKALAFVQIEADIIEKNSYHLNESDGIFLRYTAATRRFDIVLQQKTYQALTATQTIQSISNYIQTPQAAQKEVNHATRTKDLQQPHA